MSCLFCLEAEAPHPQESMFGLLLIVLHLILAFLFLIAHQGGSHHIPKQK